MANPPSETFNLFRRWKDARICLNVTVCRWAKGFEPEFQAIVSGIETETLRLLPLRGGEEKVVELGDAILLGPLPTPEGTENAMVIPSVSHGDGIVLLHPSASKVKS